MTDLGRVEKQVGMKNTCNGQNESEGSKQNFLRTLDSKEGRDVILLQTSPKKEEEEEEELRLKNLRQNGKIILSSKPWKEEKDTWEADVSKGMGGSCGTHRGQGESPQYHGRNIPRSVLANT